MPKHFNTAGPCKADIHYLLSPTVRLPELKALIDGQNYFIIHAPRQMGKTTAMLALAEELTASGEYTAVMLSVEVGAPFSQDPAAAEQAILSEWQQSIRFRLPQELRPTQWPSFETKSLLSTFLSDWAATAQRPLVLFLDEIDSLQDEALIFILRQLRSGFPNRPQGFLHSLGLIGMRDVRDYKVKSGGSEGLRPAFGDRLYTASPFNIKAESLTLRNFNFE